MFPVLDKNLWGKRRMKVCHNKICITKYPICDENLAIRTYDYFHLWREPQWSFSSWPCLVTNYVHIRTHYAETVPKI